MRSPTALNILEVWELGQTRSPLDRALLVLTAASPDESWEDLAALPIGQRDARLLTLREQLFGPEFVSQASCPKCGSRLEVSFTADDVRARGETPPGNGLSLCAAGHEIEFRLPTSLDLLSIAGRTGDAAEQALLDRCLLKAHRDGEETTAAGLPAEVVDEIITRMSEADPQADTRTSLTCVACGHRWDTVFDISQFLWAEIDSWALRALREVHLLASAYGWSESEILRLSPLRRHFYLQCAS